MTCRFPGWRDERSTLGDDVRQRRLLNCQTMNQAGRQLGLTASTIWNWENHQKEPGLQSLPAIVRFLGYDPLEPAETLGEQLVRYREIRGVSQKEMAGRFGIDPSTPRRWERGERQPMGPRPERIQGMCCNFGGLRLVA
jgi:transcriptional regulator with XRE-family HTH domain